MTTIHTIQDLLRVLEENPEWVEELRKRLLSRELLEMPERLARFSESVMQKLAEHDAQFQQIDARFEQIDARAVEVDARFERIEERLDTIQNDIAPIKGRYALTITREQADGLAYHMNLSLTDKVTQRELIGMIRNSDTTDIPRNELDSFINADLVFRAADDDGDERYVAIEASHTADDRDTYRAIRNAQYLTRFTSLPSTAVISAARIDDRIAETIDSGQVYWYRLDESKFFRAE